MPHRHKIFFIAIIIIATLSLPLFSDASLGEKGLAAGQNIGLFLSSIGSTLDQSLSFVARSAKEGVNAVANMAKRQHQMLSLSAKAIMATAERNLREQISGIHLVFAWRQAGQ